MEGPPTTILLIRHAHVDTGPEPGLLCGSFDLPVSPTGRRALDALGARPPACRPDVLYSSSLARARETAEVLASVWHLPCTADDGLREIHCGVLDGRPIAWIKREYPELWSRNQAQLDDEFAWPEGESYRQFRERTLSALRRIARRHQGQRVAVVTHAGVIAQVVGTVLGRPAAVWEEGRPAHLSLSEIVWANGTPRSVVSFNQLSWCRSA
ncbi:MAG TPA: histidine phosphatase family protein [Vicinamibacterales bacterium]|nr:histidine phosphatase family protein [Vicinamibacterales bacterium]